MILILWQDIFLLWTESLAIFLLLSCLYVQFLIDLKHLLLSIYMSVKILILGLILNFTDFFIDIQSAIIGAIVGYSSLFLINKIYFLIRKKDGIGGGDWAKDRIVPDCIRAWSEGRNSEIRNPYSTRPWQHVLEPLSGYLCLAEALIKDNTLTGEAFNFGPSEEHDYTVGDLVEELSSTWKDSSWSNIGKEESPYYEAGLLKLNCQKAKNLLSWKSCLSFEKTAEWTGNWYYDYYHKSPKEAFSLTKEQIREYMALI